MPRLSRKKERQLRDTLNRFPSYTMKRVSDELQLDIKTVTKFKKEMAFKFDSEFIAITAGKFIAVFQKAADYWLNQITELEELKSKTTTIYIKNETTGGSFEQEVSLSPMEKLAICKHQADLHKNILFLAGQGEVREVIRLMRTGKIPMLVQESTT